MKQAMTFQTPLGLMWAQANPHELISIDYLSRSTQPKAAHWVSLTSAYSPLQLLTQQLKEYFDRKRTQFDLPLGKIGTDFQQKSWQALQQIPFGEIRSYLQQAQAIQKPKAVRAVANANRCNAWSIVVPCHRVIGSDRKLTGYAGGLWRKQWLIKFEQGHI